RPRRKRTAPCFQLPRPRISTIVTSNLRKTNSTRTRFSPSSLRSRARPRTKTKKNSLDEKSHYRNAKKARFYQPGFFFCLGRYSVLEGVIFAQFHEAVEIRQRLAAFGPEETTSVARFHDAVGAECTKGVAQFAPADNRPD